MKMFKQFNRLMLGALCLIAVAQLMAGYQPAMADTIAQDKLITGSSVDIVNQSINSTGGTLTVNLRSDALDGLSINVPQGSYSETRVFKVSESSITGHSFGPAFNPISPLITIDNGGGYADRLMTVKIPVRLPDGHFAMGFTYDEKTGELQGMQLLAIEGGLIKIGMTHFGRSFVISSIPRDALDREIISGFMPGRDDWEFPNYGSYIAPWGHCSGQTLAALWYYHEKPDGAGRNLYGSYGGAVNYGTPRIWQDDEIGYKFSSIIQVDYQGHIRNGSQAVAFFSELARLGDKDTLAAFRYSMLITGQPQYIEVWNFKERTGHALIVYKIAADGTLMVADPNYPANLERKIQFAGGEFTPYNSAANAQVAQQGKGMAYDSIIYCVNTDMLPYDAFAKRWGEVKSGHVADPFPQYTLQVCDKSGREQGLLSDNATFTTDQKVLKFALDLPIKDFDISLYRDGKYLSTEDGVCELKPGDNLIGVAVWGNSSHGQGLSLWKWVDFKYYDIVYSGS